MRGHLIRLTIAIAVIGFSGCQTRDKLEIPKVSLQKSFSSSGNLELPNLWWLVFKDPQLDGFIQKALDDNFSLWVTRDRLEHVNLLAQQSRSSRQPNLNADARAARSLNAPENTSRTYKTELSLGLSAAYEVDLWGRLRSNTLATELHAKATEEDLKAAELLISAQVAKSWYALSSTHLQIGKLTEELSLQADYLKLLQLAYAHGQMDIAEVLKQKQMIAFKEGQLSKLKSQGAVLENQMEVLIGETSGAIDYVVLKKLPNLAEIPKTGIPAEWLKARPDIRSAFLRIQEADQRLAVAISNRFPRIQLSASLSSLASSPQNIFRNWLVNIVGGLSAPLLDGNKLKLEVSRQKVLVKESAHRYLDKVLHAIQEVEDTLVREKYQRELIDKQLQQLAYAKESLLQKKLKYRHSGELYNQYLLARIAYKSLESSYIQSCGEALLLDVELCQSLAHRISTKSLRIKLK